MGIKIKKDTEFKYSTFFLGYETQKNCFDAKVIATEYVT